MEHLGTSNEDKDIQNKENVYRVFVGTTAPSSPQLNDIWIDIN